MRGPWFVYILRCADGTLYTGISNDVARRLATHNAGRGARYVRTRRPAELVWWEEAGDHGAALRREAAIKRSGRAAKERLAGAGVPEWPAAGGSGLVVCSGKPVTVAPVRWFHL